MVPIGAAHAEREELATADNEHLDGREREESLRPDACAGELGDGMVAALQRSVWARALAETEAAYRVLQSCTTLARPAGDVVSDTMQDAVTGLSALLVARRSTETLHGSFGARTTVAELEAVRCPTLTWLTSSEKLEDGTADSAGAIRPVSSRTLRWLSLNWVLQDPVACLDSREVPKPRCRRQPVNVIRWSPMSNPLIPQPRQLLVIILTPSCVSMLGKMRDKHVGLQSSCMSTISPCT